MKLWTPDQPLGRDDENLFSDFEDAHNIQGGQFEGLFQKENTDSSGVAEESEVVDRQVYTEMIRNMRSMADKVNSDKEVADNGFQYPVEWLDAFEQKLNACLDRGESPDIGIVGYGSLQNPDSLAGTTSSRATGVVTMQGVRRGLYFSGLARAKNDWKDLGLDYNSEQAVMAVKHDKTSYCNGVRIPLPNSTEDMKKLHTREFAYDLLPGPPATGDDGRVSDLNLLCWPLGRTLMNELKGDQFAAKLEDVKMEKEDVSMMPLSLEQTDQFMALETAEEQKDFLAVQKTLLSDEQRDTFGQLESGVVTAYDKRIAQLYDLGEKPLPHMAYVHSCLNMGNAKAEEEFLDTTYCYSPEKKEITLREYLEKYAPKTNSKVRAGGDVADGGDAQSALRARSRTKVF